MARMGQQSDAEKALTRAKEAAEAEMKAFDLGPVEYARKRLTEGLLDAALTMVEIAKGTDLDSPFQDQKLRFDAAKYLLDRAFGSVSPTSGEHTSKQETPIESFLATVVTGYPADK